MMQFEVSSNSCGADMRANLIFVLGDGGAVVVNGETVRVRVEARLSLVHR